MLVAGLRIGIGALVLILILFVKKERLPLKLHFWKKVFIAGFFAQALPFTLINWGEQYVDSSLASLLNGLTPLSTIVLAQLLLKDEKMTGNKIVGVVLGLVGLMILVTPSLLEGVTGTTQGILAITLAAISYGVGLVFIRKNLINVPPIHAPAAQLLSVTIYLLPLAFFTTPEFSISELSPLAIIAIGVLGVFGTAIAFVLYFKLLERTSAAYVSTVTYLMPIYGVILGIIFLDEKLTVWMLLGAISILSGISMVNKRKSKSFTGFGKHLDRSYYSHFR